METEAKYIKKIRDALKKKTGGVSKIFSGPNTKAKYLNDIAKTIDDIDIGGELDKDKVFIIRTYTAPGGVEKASVTFTEMNIKFSDGYAILLQRPTNKGGLAKLDEINYDTPGKIIAKFSSIGKPATQNGNITEVTFWQTDVEFTMDGESNTVSTVETNGYLFTKCVEKSTTLTAGQTTASFVVSTSEISDLSSSSIDIYTSIWGAEPTDVRISGTNLLIDFDAQQTDMTVKVRIS